MFIFIQTNTCENNNIIWNNFITDIYQQLNNKNNIIIYNIKLLESIIIQEIYIHYLLPSLQKIYYGFNYNTPFIYLNDTNFWKVCTVQYENDLYYYHKITNLLFIKNGSKFIWIGIYDITNDKIVYRSKCNKFIEEWIIGCGFI